jgi:prepilin peptidase dependent protein B
MLSHPTKSSRFPVIVAARRGSVRGLSIVELMIGVAIGLFIVAGGAKLLADGLMGNRRSIIEARISQDLRTAADVIARDLRRAGYSADAHLGVTDAAHRVPNAYRAVTPTPSNGSGPTVTYSYSQDTNGSLSDAEKLGFTLGSDNGVGVLQMKMGETGGNPNWQPLTDPRSVNVTSFAIRAVTGEISLGKMCGASTVASPACCSRYLATSLCKPEVFERSTSGYAPNNGVAVAVGVQVHDDCPEVIVRRFDIVIAGTGLPPNNDVQREIRESVRVRNDEVTRMVCP